MSCVCFHAFSEAFNTLQHSTLNTQHSTRSHPCTRPPSDICKQEVLGRDALYLSVLVLWEGLLSCCVGVAPYRPHHRRTLLKFWASPLNISAYFVLVLTSSTMVVPLTGSGTGLGECSPCLELKKKESRPVLFQLFHCLCLVVHVFGCSFCFWLCLIDGNM